MQIRKASERFDQCELRLIQETFKDLSHLSRDSKYIDKETFLQYFPLPGLLGERLFAVFDRKNVGRVDYEDFICGLAVTCRGSCEEKIKFIFDIYDVNHSNAVSREELSALLNHAPKSIMKLGRALFSSCQTKQSNVSNSKTQNEILSSHQYIYDQSLCHENGSDGSIDHERTDEEMSHDENKFDHPFYHHYDEYTNSDIVNQAFEECDLDKDGKLSYKEFKLWIDRTPYIAMFLQSVFPYDENREWGNDIKHLPFIHNKDMASVDSKNSLNTSEVSIKDETPQDEAIRLLFHVKELTSNKKVISGIEELVEIIKSDTKMNRKISNARMLSNSNQSQLVQISGVHLSPRTARVLHHQTITKQGFLSKRGHRLRAWKQRWYMLVGNCIYYYQLKNDKTPRGVIFLTGSFVEPLNEEENEKRQYWGLEISRVQENGLRRRFYASSRAERERWVRELRRASEVIPIEDDYEIGNELGVGQFSRVCECVNKHTLETKAVKIIEKEAMDAEEKELLRTEIAIMKLVNHPNIIRMESVYESRNQIFIVLELHSGGDLFERVNGKPRLTEDETFCIIYPLIESVAYLHEMGIVHRDLKPENILCGHKIGDIKIADFGLSKVILPDEIMDMPCGTLSYVAPEVLILNGYGKEADMWSVGTIMYLLLRGRLPFDIDGESREKIIERTINGQIDTDDPLWQAISEDAQSLILGLLTKDIKRRMSAKEALFHPWITKRIERFHANPVEFDF